VAAGRLERAALQFVAVCALVPRSDATQAQLRGARTRLYAVARACCAAHGHPPPAGAV